MSSCPLYTGKHFFCKKPYYEKTKLTIKNQYFSVQLIHKNYDFKLSKLNITIDILLVDRLRLEVRVMVFNATFNNISVISWRSVEERGVPEENH
jgi:hypothetical protein